MEFEDIIKFLLSKKFIVPISIIIFAIIIYITFKHLVRKLLTIKLSGVRINDRRQKTALGLITNIIKYFISIVALLMILDTYGVDTKSLLASLGVVSLVAGLALQDFLKDIIAGFTIIFEDQYAVGDIVTIGDFKGTVTYLGAKTTRLKSFTGETLIISNRNIDKVVNHSLENCIVFIDMPISYNENIDRVKNILSEFCIDFNSNNKLLENAKVCGVQSLDDSSINIRVSFGCDYSSKMSLERLFREQAKKVFDANNIEIPFKQVVVHHG